MCCYYYVLMCERETRASEKKPNVVLVVLMWSTRDMSINSCDWLPVLAWVVGSWIISQAIWINSFLLSFPSFLNPNIQNSFPKLNRTPLLLWLSRLPGSKPTKAPDQYSGNSGAFWEIIWRKALSLPYSSQQCRTGKWWWWYSWSTLKSSYVCEVSRVRKG